MDFDFSEDQYALRDGAREFFAGECAPDHVRAMWDDDTGRSRERWRKMAETGFVGLTVPEEHDGLGMGEVDLVLILEQAGYAALPEPLLETTAVGVPLLLEGGSDSLRKEWLPRIAAGEAIVTIGFAGRPLVPDAHVADLLILQRQGPQGVELHAVPKDRFNATAQPSMDRARRVFTVEAETGDDTRMPGGADVAARAWDRAVAGTAAFLNGLSQRMLDMTLQYVQERQQFNRTVGSFQAVKHKLAETFLLTETSKAAGWYAAYAIAHDLPDRTEAASVAKAYASDAAEKANRESLQLHGGIGFTWEHDLHLWLKRSTALERTYGTAAEHRRTLADVAFTALAPA